MTSPSFNLIKLSANYTSACIERMFFENEEFTRKKFRKKIGNILGDYFFEKKLIYRGDFDFEEIQIFSGEIFLENEGFFMEKRITFLKR